MSDSGHEAVGHALLISGVAVLTLGVVDLCHTVLASLQQFMTALE